MDSWIQRETKLAFWKRVIVAHVSIFIEKQGLHETIAIVLCSRCHEFYQWDINVMICTQVPICREVIRDAAPGPYACVRSSETAPHAAQSAVRSKSSSCTASMSSTRKHRDCAAHFPLPVTMTRCSDDRYLFELKLIQHRLRSMTSQEYMNMLCLLSIEQWLVKEVDSRAIIIRGTTLIGDQRAVVCDVSSQTLNGALCITTGIANRSMPVTPRAG